MRAHGVETIKPRLGYCARGFAGTSCVLHQPYVCCSTTVASTLEPLKQYEYIPLTFDDEIRLLQILPGRYGDELRCDIIHYRLQSPSISSATSDIKDRHLDFEALSYCWGDNSVREQVFCGSDGTVVFATPSCVAALRRLRLCDRCRLLWVDALCINQSDMNERNRQLLLMSRIYNTAAEVLIYLGEGTEDSDLAIDLIVSHQGNAQFCRNPTDQEKFALTNFFSRPWFSRVWVLQEVAWSRSASFICGARSVGWEACRGLSDYPWSYSTWFPLSERYPRVELPPIVRLTRGNAIIDAYTPTALFNILVQSLNCLSTDPRDKIFALLPLFAQAVAAVSVTHFPIADYQLSVVQIYTSISAMLLREHGPDTLSTVISSSMELLPSWVTDWSLPYAKNRLSFKEILQFHYFKPSPHLGFHPQVNIKFSAGGSVQLWNPISETFHCSTSHKVPTLMMNGLELDGIETVTPACNVKMKGWEYLIFTFWPNFSATNDARRIQDSNHIDHCYETMILMSDAEMDTWAPLTPRLREWFTNPGSFDLTNQDNQAVRVMHDRAELVCHGRSLIRTQDGRICLGPPESAIGDDIYVLEGASTPFVLRRSGHDFRLIGECYVPGIMQVEILRIKDAKSTSGQLWKKVRIIWEVSRYSSLGSWSLDKKYVSMAK